MKTKSFYAYSFLKVHLHHSSKIKSHKEVTKQYKAMFFFILLLVYGRIQIRIWNTDRTRVGICVVSLLHSQKKLMLQAPKNIDKYRNQFSGSVTFWYGSGSGSMCG
jgi:hypothetical protein